MKLTKKQKFHYDFYAQKMGRLRPLASNFFDIMKRFYYAYIAETYMLQGFWNIEKHGGFVSKPPCLFSPSGETRLHFPKGKKIEGFDG